MPSEASSPWALNRRTQKNIEKEKKRKRQVNGVSKRNNKPWKRVRTMSRGWSATTVVRPATPPATALSHFHCDHMYCTLCIATYSTLGYSFLRCNEISLLIIIIIFIITTTIPNRQSRNSFGNINQSFLHHKSNHQCVGWWWELGTFEKTHNLFTAIISQIVTSETVQIV